MRQQEERRAWASDSDSFLVGVLREGSLKPQTETVGLADLVELRDLLLPPLLRCLGGLTCRGRACNSSRVLRVRTAVRPQARTVVL